VHRFFSAWGAWADGFVRRFLPDPFVLVLLLTALALVGGWLSLGVVPGTTDGSELGRANAILAAWIGGFGNAELLKFGFQILLIVVTGEAVAASPLAARLLRRLTAWPRSASQALFLVTGFALVTGWIHWGFGLVSSAVLAREVGRSCRTRGIAVHYPLLGMGAYTSMLIWHAGLTASAPLLMNTEQNFVSGALGLSGAEARVPVSETILAPYNLVACAVLVALVPFVVVAMQPAVPVGGAPEPPAAEPPEAGLAAEESSGVDSPSSGTPHAQAAQLTWAERLDHARILPIAVGAAGLCFLPGYLREHGLDLNHNVVNATFLMLGLCLHPTAVSYARAIAASMRGLSGVVLQFPFYGGILAVMTVSGLSERIAHVFIALASAKTLPFFTYVASVATKGFVPSGAGEWAVEGPVMLKAAQALGVPFGKITMGVAYGNMVGNMYQPFWSLPLLGLMGLRARDIMGFGLVIFAVCAPVLGLVLLVG
jgi:short-chain fatty acids transporter